MSDIEVDIRTDENVHGVTDPSAAGPATQSRYNRDLLSSISNKRFSFRPFGPFSSFGPFRLSAIKFGTYLQIDQETNEIFVWISVIASKKRSKM